MEEIQQALSDFLLKMCEENNLVDNAELLTVTLSKMINNIMFDYFVEKEFVFVMSTTSNDNQSLHTSHSIKVKDLYTVTQTFNEVIGQLKKNHG